MKRKRSGSEEGVSPVIGVILMVAITVILAALVGTFVLGIPEGVSDPLRASVEVTQDSNSVEVTVIDVGNLDDAQMVGPQGGKSMRFENSLGVGTRIIIDRRGFNNSDTNVTLPPSNVRNEISSDTSELDKDLLTDGEECIIRHSAEVVYGVRINGSDIGCSGKVLEKIADPDGVGNIDDPSFAGSEIPYQADAVYQFIGQKESTSTVIRRIRSGDF